MCRIHLVAFSNRHPARVADLLPLMAAWLTERVELIKLINDWHWVREAAVKEWEALCVIDRQVNSEWRWFKSGGKHFHLAPQEEVKILNEINCCWLWTHLSQNQTYLFCCECVRGWARAMCVLWGSKTPGCDCVAVNNLNRCESNVIKTKGSQCFAQERIISSTPLPSNNEILILCTRRLKPKMMSD